MRCFYSVMDIILINRLILTIRSWSCTDFLNDQSPLNMNAVCIFQVRCEDLVSGNRQYAFESKTLLSEWRRLHHSNSTESGQKRRGLISVLLTSTHNFTKYDERQLYSQATSDVARRISSRKLMFLSKRGSAFE